MITELWVRNYRSLADARLTLEPLTVLVGPNGSGKSNLVDVLRFVAEALQYGLDAAIINRHGMSALRRWSAKGRPYDVEIGLSFKTPAMEGRYSFVLGSRRRGEYSVKSEHCSLFKPTDPLSRTEFETRKGEWVSSPAEIRPAIRRTALVLPLLTGLGQFKDLHELVTRMSFYNILPNELTEPQKPANPYPLDEHGENLASVLRKLGRKRELERALASVLGDISNYQVSQVGGYLVTKLRHESPEGERAPLFELAQESDGTLRLLGILTALYQDPPRTLIALEEPELTIHPGAMALLWEEILSVIPGTQVLLTTHSPDLMDLCEAEQLRVVEKIDGATHVGPIAQEQRRIIRKRLFAPGQLLQAQGLRRSVAKSP